jgi:hypothetical protein
MIACFAPLLGRHDGIAAQRTGEFRFFRAIISWATAMFAHRGTVNANVHATLC